jgi:hypothetical protein
VRLVTICDVDGNIVGLSTFPEGGARISVPNLPLGHQEIEVDAPDIGDDMDESEVYRRLNGLISDYRVDMSRRQFVAR